MGINFLSDTDKDYKCLEQYIATNKFGILHDKKMSEVAHNIDEVRNILSLYLPAPIIDLVSKEISNNILPTKYDSLLDFSILKGLIEEIKAAAKTFNLDTSEFPLYATIPTGTVNARAIHPDCSSKTFILFDSQMSTFCNLFAKAFALCLPTDENSYSFSLEKVSSHINENIDCIYRVQEFLYAHCYEGEFSKAEQYFIEEKKVHLNSFFLKGMELFVVGHEFGHIYAEHTSNFMNSHCINGERETYTINKSHLQEYEADFFGMLLGSQAYRNLGCDLDASFIGSYLYFCAFDLTERYDYLLNNNHFDNFKYKETETHPSNIDRRTALKRHTKLFYNDSVKQEMFMLFDNLDEVIDLIWSHILENHNF